MPLHIHIGIESPPREKVSVYKLFLRRSLKISGTSSLALEMIQGRVGTLRGREVAQVERAKNLTEGDVKYTNRSAKIGLSAFETAGGKGPLAPAQY